jgi:uncharacterized membrane protein
VSTVASFPAWSELLFIAALAVVGVTVAAIARTRQRHVKRRIYWAGLLSAVGCASVSLLPLGVKATVIVFVAFSLVVVFQAYVSTPYLKIGGRIFALKISDSGPDPVTSDSPQPPTTSVAPPDDHYVGQLSATTYWTIMAILTVCVSAAVYFGGWIPQTVPAVVVLTALAVPLGIGDATKKLPVARGRWIQAGIIAVASAILWMGPPLAYLIGYQIGRVRPMERDS